MLSDLRCFCEFRDDSFVRLQSLRCRGHARMTECLHEETNEIFFALSTRGTDERAGREDMTEWTFHLVALVKQIT